MKTLYIVPGSECGHTHAFEVEIDAMGSLLRGEAQYNIREVKIPNTVAVRTIVVDEFNFGGNDADNRRPH